MKGRRADKERLGHILDAINSIESFTVEITQEAFIGNYMLQLAVVKLLENIGEASHKLTKETQTEFSEIDWAIMIRARNIMEHDYFRINLQVIWDTIKNDLPGLKEKIERIYNNSF